MDKKEIKSGIGVLLTITALIAVPYFLSDDGSISVLDETVDLNNSIFAEKTATPTEEPFYFSTEQGFDDPAPIIEEPPMLTEEQPMTTEVMAADESFNLVDGWTVGSGIFLIVCVGLLVAAKTVAGKAKGAKKPVETAVTAPVKAQKKAVFSKPAKLSFPMDIFNQVNDVLRVSGGYVDKEKTQPRFWAELDGCIDLPIMWSIPVKYASGADVRELHDMLANLEEALIGFTVRTAVKPSRIEIDKQQMPALDLADSWAEIKTMPRNKLHIAPALTWENGTQKLYKNKLEGDKQSIFLCANPGAGKGQFASAMMLSFFMLNSPAKVVGIICDPKVIDFKPYNRIPHLAIPVLTKVEEIAAVTRKLVSIMNERIDATDRGDRSWMDSYFFIYYDEVTYVLDILEGSEKDEFAKSVKMLINTGRAAGIIVVEATQRASEIDKKMHSKTGLKFIGKLGDAKDSADAAGVKGAKTNLLPSPGAFQVFGAETGTRIQGLFVADAKQPDYFDKLGFYFNEIETEWAGIEPHTKLDLDDMAGDDDADDTDMVKPIKRSHLVEIEPEEEVDEAERYFNDDDDLKALPIEVVTMLEDVYINRTKKWCKERVKEAFKSHDGSTVFDERAKRIFEKFTEYMRLK